MKRTALCTARCWRRGVLIAAALLTVGTTTAAAQGRGGGARSQRRSGSPASATRGNAGVAVPTGPISLTYRFVPGQVMQTQTRMEADLKMAFGAPPAARLQPQPAQPASELPIRVDSTGMMTRRVTAVSDEGTGTLSVTLDALKMAMTGLGLSIVITGSHGKLTATANGRAIDPAQTPFGETGVGQMIGKPVVMRMTPTGEITQVEGLPQSGTMQLPGMNMQHLFTGGVVLPDHRVSKGDSWTSKSSTPVPMPSGQTAQMQTTLTSTLKSLDAQGAHLIASIETKGTVAMPGQRTFNETFTSGTRFDVTSGVTLASTLQMQVAMDLAAQTGGAPNPPAGGFPAATMHGTIKISTGPLPLSVDTRPGAAPADRAPARRPIIRRR